MGTKISLRGVLSTRFKDGETDLSKNMKSSEVPTLLLLRRQLSLRRVG